MLGETLRADVDALNNTNFFTENLFGLWVAGGLNDPAHNMPYLMQGGLGMPDRAYYLTDSPKMAELRTKFHAEAIALARDYDAKGFPRMALRTLRGPATALPPSAEARALYFAVSDKSGVSLLNRKSVRRCVFADEKTFVCVPVLTVATR